MDRKLHILYIVQYFNHPSEPGGSRPYQFARYWAAQGHQVTVLTSNLNHKTLSTLPPQSIESGFTVIRVATYNRIRGSIARRFVNFLSFAGLATVRGLRVRRVDIVYASSTPLTTGLAGWAVSLLKRRPFYFEVRDLWPRSAVVAGVFRDGPAVRVIEWFERLFYRSAVKVVALTQGIRDGVIAAGKNPDDVLLVPNGMDDWMLDARPSQPPTFPWNPSNEFVCTYIGAHGRWNMIETILESASLLSDTRVRFLLIGDGDHKKALVAYAGSLGLTNVCFLDAIPKQHVLDYLHQSHVSLICTWDHEFQRMVLANKVFDYLAAGCPVIAAARGETEALIEHSGGGWTVPPERPAELADLIRAIAQLPPEELRQRGSDGREYVRRHYLRSTLAHRLQRTFETAAASL